jgi:photosystem II stability/assembly factor-like uncharacterized protein
LVVVGLVVVLLLGGLRTDLVHGQQGDVPWRLLSFPETGVPSIAFSPTFHSDRLIIITTVNGTYRSTDGGKNWVAIKSPVLMGPYVFSPAFAEDRTLFAGSDTGVYRSTDAGLTWANSGLSTDSISSIVISPAYATDRTLYAGTRRDPNDISHVYRSTDGGAGWARTTFRVEDHDVRPMVISPDYPRDHTIFVGVGLDWDWYTGGVYRSTDAGATWMEANNGLVYREVHGLAVSPNYARDHTLLVTVWQGGVQRSTDGGNSWTEWNHDQPNRRLTGVAFSPNYAQDTTVFLATWGEYVDGGVYRSTNGGMNWTPMLRDLTTVWIHQVVPSPDYARDCMLLAGGEHSKGGGLWINICPVPPTPVPTLTPVPVVPIPGSGNRLFPETGQTASGLFLDYWNEHGGLAQQGYPISGLFGEISDLNGKPYTVQYFERAVFEYHPENQAPYNVLLSQLGTLQYRSKYRGGAPNQTPNKTAARYFAETGHWVGGKFWDYWQSHGGLAQQGYPISDEFTEVNDLNKKPYTVQYFERAVFELHSENQPPYDILLSLLGTLRYHPI